MAGRLLGSLHTAAPLHVLRNHVHTARMLFSSATAASGADAGLQHSLPTGPSPADALSPDAATAAPSPPAVQPFHAADTVPEMFRRHNTSLPDLQGQVVAGTVLQADKRTVLIDVGYKSLQRFFRSELADAPIYTPEGRSRGIPAELVVGDLLHFTIRDLDTVFGDMLLDVHSLRPDERLQRVLRELEEAKETQTPVLGRVLNPVTQGFAVGLGGLIAFMPLSQCLVRTAQRVGVLQSFLVAKVSRDVSMHGTLQPNVVVLDAAKVQADEEYWRQKRERPAQELMFKREQDARASEAGRRATAAYAMLRKSREAREKASSEASAS